MHAESEVARTKGFWPGHLKWDYAYSIGQLRPDVVTQLWGVKASDLPWLQNDYSAAKVDGYQWYVRRDTSHFRWKAVGADQ